MDREPLIFTRLHGRLGNQMFQYAAAVGLADRLGVPVALDPRVALHKNEGVLTRVFDLPAEIPNHLPPVRHDALLAYMVWRLSGRSPKFQRERGLSYNNAFEHWADDTYLHGYWQSERYFSHAANRVRKDFTFPAKMSAANAEMAARITAATSISLHVRRGDYLTGGAHGVCDQAYYDTALARIAAALPSPPTVFVFSDDPDWARQNLPMEFEKVVVDFNGAGADFEDMRLMSLCEHNITANSSFSWWGAWLNANPSKLVAAPSQWFADSKLKNGDILPASWLPIE